MSAAIIPFRLVTNPHAPRARCSRCNGRRVIDIGILEPEYIPCPACTFRDPRGASTTDERPLRRAA